MMLPFSICTASLDRRGQKKNALGMLGPMNAIWATGFFGLWLTAVSISAVAQEPPGFRLGDVAEPRRYEAQVALDPREETFSGEIRIHLVFSRATPVLWLNAHRLTVQSAEFRQGARTIAAKVLPGGEDHLGFAAEGEPFAAGPATATIRYTGVIDRVDSRGVYSQEDNGEWYVVTQFEAISARRAFPCFDEPGWKTPWQLTIDAPPEYIWPGAPAAIRKFTGIKYHRITGRDVPQNRKLPYSPALLAIL